MRIHRRLTEIIQKLSIHREEFLFGGIEIINTRILLVLNSRISRIDGRIVIKINQCLQITGIVMFSLLGKTDSFVDRYELFANKGQKSLCSLSIHALLVLVIILTIVHFHLLLHHNHHYHLNKVKHPHAFRSL